MMGKRIGIVTGGGDCPGLNAVIRAVCKAANRRQWEMIGILGGFDGLLSPDSARLLDYRVLGAMLVRGGTILGTSNRGKFTAKTGHGETQEIPEDVLLRAHDGYTKLQLDALVCIGGDGSLSIAHQLSRAGMRVVGVPKTIDNDLAATDRTFGFDSALACATDAIDRLHSTAESHGRVMVLEVMGRNAGWIALYSGVAGGADVILIPEIPFLYEPILAKIKERADQGKHFTVIVVAEGAFLAGSGQTTLETSEHQEVRLGGVGELVTRELTERLKTSVQPQQARCVVLGHLQRGGPPTHYDRLLCSMFGTEAVELIARGEFGRMVTLNRNELTSCPLEEAIGKLKVVEMNGSVIKAARSLGICLGD